MRRRAACWLVRRVSDRYQGAADAIADSDPLGLPRDGDIARLTAAGNRAVRTERRLIPLALLLHRDAAQQEMVEQAWWG